MSFVKTPEEFVESRRNIIRGDYPDKRVGNNVVVSAGPQGTGIYIGKRDPISYSLASAEALVDQLQKAIDFIKEVKRIESESEVDPNERYRRPYERYRNTP